MSVTNELVRVVRGQADDESLAALVTVLAGLAASASRPLPAPARSAWSGTSWSNGPGAWRRSALPR